MSNKKNNRLLAKPAAASKVRGEAERRTAVYTSVHEDSSTASTKQFATAVRFGKKSIINCPSCGSPGTWTSENKNRPFCSPRCKLIDLGNWASEEHRIPGAPVIFEDTLHNDDSENKKDP